MSIVLFMIHNSKQCRTFSSKLKTHWKREQVEKIELRDNLKDFYVSLSKPSDDEDKQKQKLEQYEAKDNELEKWGTLNVLGQPAEPICTYYRCHHKFSLHGS
jgi:hypothetical protein